MKKCRRLPVVRLLSAPLVPAALLAGAVAEASTAHVGANFNGNAGQLNPEDNAGAPGYAQTNWNHLNGGDGGPAPLNDATGAPTAIRIQWGANNVWNDGANGGNTPDKRLMKGYLDSNGQPNGVFDGFASTRNDEPLILLTGLDEWMEANGFTSYSIVVYTDGDDKTGTRSTRLWLASTGGSIGVDPGLGGNLTPQVEVADAANFGETEAYVEVPAVAGSVAEGNFTVFKSQTAGSVYLRTEEAGTHSLFRGPINAIQIVGLSGAPVDTDGDGLSDEWEIMWGLDPEDDGTDDPNNGAAGDPDGDGVSNLDEYLGRTNPVHPDSDGDGLDDGEERDLGTNPLYSDTDEDGMPDAWEVRYGLDPTDDGSDETKNGPNGDPDEDDLFNLDEYLAGTDPTNEDTDGDGYPDGAEDGIGTWGGLNATGTDPLHVDSDGDGLPDGEENPSQGHVPGSVAGTDPNLEDTDGDGITDRWEILLGLDPTDASAGESLPVVPLVNAGFEEPATAGFTYDDPPGWTISENASAQFQSFTENSASVNLKGGEGLNLFGLQALNGRLTQDSGVAFQPNTTYLVDVQGVYRPVANIDGGEAPARFEFGLYSSEDAGARLDKYPGFIDERGINSAAGNPDADDRFRLFRSASSMAGIGSGSLGRVYSFVTGDTPPPGNVGVYIEQVTAGRVIFDNVRIFAVPNDLDGDEDGLPDAWELANGLDPASKEGDDGAEGDPDGDGLSNAEELAAGTHPNDASSGPVVTGAGPRIVSAGFNGDAFEIVVENLDMAKSYRLTRGADLSGFDPLGDPVTGVESHTFIDPSPLPERGFYRIEDAP